MSKLNFYLKYFLINLSKFINCIIYKKKQFAELNIITSLPFVLINFLKKNSQFETSCLADICVIDNPNRTERFEILYNLLSIKRNFRFYIKTFTNLRA
jgi:NADH:ubiquinone oxidoreductase subunit C